MTAAIPVTTRRLGPSGSRKNANIALEQTRAVIARISKEPFLKCIRVQPHLRMPNHTPSPTISTKCRPSAERFSLRVQHQPNEGARLWRLAGIEQAGAEDTAEQYQLQRHEAGEQQPGAEQLRRGNAAPQPRQHGKR